MASSSTVGEAEGRVPAARMYTSRRVDIDDILGGRLLTWGREAALAQDDQPPAVRDLRRGVRGVPM